MEGGCWVPVSHVLNNKGYFWKGWGTGEKAVRELFHRFIYRAVHGAESIPAGHEIDHICRNRACQNPEHLRLLDKDTHRRISDETRYRDTSARLAPAKKHWEETGCGVRKLAALFGEASTTMFRWVKHWKEQTA